VISFDRQPRGTFSELDQQLFSDFPWKIIEEVQPWWKWHDLPSGKPT